MTEAHYKFWLIEIRTHSYTQLLTFSCSQHPKSQHPSFSKKDGWPIYSCAYDNLMILFLPYVLDGSLHLVGI